MWCPKCKNEYVDGIIMCADCGVSLVSKLPTEHVADEVATSLQHLAEELDHADLIADDVVSMSETDEVLADVPSHAYIEKSDQFEDLRSTAYTFTIIGLLGIICLILFDFGLFPITVVPYMKIMLNIVMGIMFIAFTFVGIRSFQQLKGLRQEVIAEEETTKEIQNWFLNSYSSRSVDALYAKDKSTEEQLYFKRYDIMKQLIQEKYPELSEDYLDHMIELLYEKIFEIS